MMLIHYQIQIMVKFTNNVDDHRGVKNNDDDYYEMVEKA